MRICQDEAHDKLKLFYEKLFIKLGYKVELEKPINKYRVDVYAKRDEEVIIIECGYCDGNKLKDLRRDYEKVIHIPYLDGWMQYPYRKLEIPHMTTEELARSMGIKNVPR